MLTALLSHLSGMVDAHRRVAYTVFIARIEAIQLSISVPLRQPGRRPRRRMWTVQEFLKAGDKGIFRPDERLELLEGEIIPKVSPQKSYHAFGISAVAEGLEQALGKGFHVRIQVPLELGR